RDDGGAVLRSDVGALTVLQGRIGDDREQYLQKLVIADDRWIVRDSHHLGMVGHSGGDEVILGALRGAAVVSGYCAGHALGMAENRFNTPEAAACKDRRLETSGFLGGALRHRRIEHGLCG